MVTSAESVLYGKPPHYGFRAVWKTKRMFADIEGRDGVTVVAPVDLLRAALGGVSRAVGGGFPDPKRR